MSIDSPNRTPRRNKLVVPSMIIACSTVVAGLFVAFILSKQFYLFFLLPFGLLAAILARIALNQIQHGNGTPQDRLLAILAYFLGLSPVLYFCATLTYQLVSLWW